MNNSLPKGVRLAEVTRDLASFLWEQWNQHPRLFMDHERGDHERFLKKLIAPDSLWFLYEDVGTMYFTEILPGRIAKFHAMFWDGRLKGRQEVALELIGWMFQTFGLEKVWASVPEFAAVLKKNLERIGFRREGRFRKGYPCLGRNYDVFMYGMLREEYDGGILGRRERSVRDVSNDVRLSGEETSNGYPAIPLGRIQEGRGAVSGAVAGDGRTDSPPEESDGSTDRTEGDGSPGPVEGIRDRVTDGGDEDRGDERVRGSKRNVRRGRRASS